MTATSANLLDRLLTGAPTLPGDLPGLLRPGSLVTDGEDYGVVVCFMAGHGYDDEADLDEDHDGAWPTVLVAWNRCGSDSETPEWVTVDELTLDLTDEAGRDRAARWLAERVGETDYGITAPAWSRDGLAAEGTWWLEERCFGAPDVPFVREHLDEGPYDDGDGGLTVVPALARLDLADPLADTRALAICCLAVAGRI
jgi:hypothetical protein